MTTKTRACIVLLLFSLGAGRCGDGRSPTAPSETAAGQPPALQPTAVQPVVTGIAPNTSSTGGDAWGTITGTDFQAGATVRFGDAQARQVWVRDPTTIMFWTRPHTAGTVDVVVTNPGGLSGRLTAAHEFASPATFEANGEWEAHAGPDYETDMAFTIRDNALISVSCGATVVNLGAPLAVVNGEFSFRDADGIAVTGRLVSPLRAIGTIKAPACADRWWADKR